MCAPPPASFLISNIHRNPLTPNKMDRKQNEEVSDLDTYLYRKMSQIPGDDKMSVERNIKGR